MAATRVLITGADGFIGRHLVRALRAGAVADVVVGACSRIARDDSELGPMLGLDVTRRETIEHTIGQFQPTHVVHLAGIASTSGPAVDRHLIWRINVLGALDLASVMQKVAPECHLIFASSGLVYGDQAAIGQRFDEATPFAPNNEYAVTKAAADLALGAMARRGLKVVSLRLFNHCGPGQSDSFVVARYARQIARIEAGLEAPRMKVFGLDDVRDFQDVSDGVAAFVRTLVVAPDLEPGSVLNLCSGRPTRIGDVIDQLIRLSSTPIEVIPEPTTAPPSRSAGDPGRIGRVLGWRSERALADALADVLRYWRIRTSALVAGRDVVEDPNA